MNPVFVKRSNVPGKIPTLEHLGAGELAMNTADAILFFSTGTEIVEVGASKSVVNVATSIQYANSTLTITSAIAYKVGTTQLYINGLRMSLGNDYTEVSNTQLTLIGYTPGDINSVSLDIQV